MVSSHFREEASSFGRGEITQKRYGEGSRVVARLEGTLITN